MIEFTCERRIKGARKRHLCIACGTWIEARSPAMYFAQKCDGEFDTGYYHLDCRDAEVALNHRLDTWGEDWTPLDNIRDGEDGEDDWRWLVDTFPTVAARFKTEAQP
jgi:hypothetical protein